METLNAIAENIAYQLGEQFNMTLRESIKDTLIIYRSKMLRDSDNRNFDDMALFAQNLSVPLLVVDLYEELGIGAAKQALSFLNININNINTYKIIRTKEKVPVPYRSKLSHREPFRYVGSFDGGAFFHYTTLATFKYDVILPNRTNVIFYVYLNGYIYIINNLNTCDITNSLDLKELFLSSIFDNPRSAYKICDDPSVAIDDRLFPMSGDLLATIYNMVKKGEFMPGYIKDGQAVNIKPDKTDDK
jgi:hypothetical protein